MITYRCYTRKFDRPEYIKYIHIKCVNGKFYSAKPGKEYKLEPSYKSWLLVDQFLLPHFDVSETKSTEDKPLTEVQWLDKVCENFKE